MARLALLPVLLVALAICSFGQVVVTNSGFATTPGPAIPATPASPPILYTPIVQLGQGPTQPLQATADTNGVIPTAVLQQNGEEDLVQNPAPAPVVLQVVPVIKETPPARIALNLGVAQFDSSSDFSGIGENISGKTLGDVAREQRQHPGGTNARVYSNSDVEKLNQVGGTVNTPSAQANKTNDNWAPNNGIITPESSQPAQNSVGAPARQNQTPTGTRSPFAPKPQGNSPAGIELTPNQPQNRPQSEVRPFAKREGVEIAQNNPQNAPLAQSQNNPANQNAPAQSQPQASQLPRTASRLPLVGVAGLFSVSMGIFVRYQRSRAK
jgi:hypothetical protein